ncbi:MAG: hypothetical protein QMC81_11315 [Thermoanaerobacterales bacterium]|nr:hypothetical protein [Bacillota bacterium]MDI6908058.1 hypothetical protein [Thermoanaerobacterales bacterium]
MGTYVTSGTGTAVAVLTGRRTAIGGISERLARRAPETQFERGVRRFGNDICEPGARLVELPRITTNSADIRAKRRKNDNALQEIAR